MKKFFFLFALLLGLGISTALASGMQPPGDDVTLVIKSADVVSQELSLPAFELSYIYVIQENPTPVCLNTEGCHAKSPALVNKVTIDVITGSSGGISDHLCIASEGPKLQPCPWTQLMDHKMTLSLSDRAGCTQNKIHAIPVFADNCSYKFLLI